MIWCHWLLREEAPWLGCAPTGPVLPKLRGISGQTSSEADTQSGRRSRKEWLSLSLCVRWAAFAFRNQYHVKNEQSINEDLLGRREGCN